MPFVDYKGSNIAMMIELRAAPLLGESLSFGANERNNADSGPLQGGEFILALDPSQFGAVDSHVVHAERLLDRIRD